MSRDPGRLQIGLKDLVVQTPEQQWPRGDLAVTLDSDPDGEPRIRLAADYLRLDDLRRIVQIRPPSDAVKTALDALQPGGEVRDLRLAGKHTEAGLTWQARARFDGLRTLPWDNIPGVENLSGKLLGTQAHTVLTLDSDDTTLRFTRLFRDPLELPRIAGRVDLIDADDGWQLVSEQLLADARALSHRHAVHVCASVRANRCFSTCRAISATAMRPMRRTLLPDGHHGQAPGRVARRRDQSRAAWSAAAPCSTARWTNSRSRHLAAAASRWCSTPRTSPSTTATAGRR